MTDDELRRDIINLGTDLKAQREKEPSWLDIGRGLYQLIYHETFERLFYPDDYNMYKTREAFVRGFHSRYSMMD